MKKNKQKNKPKTKLRRSQDGTYIRYGIYCVDKFNDKLDKKVALGNDEFNHDITVGTGSIRVKCIIKSPVCAACGIKGKYWAAERDANSKSSPWHLNIYGLHKRQNYAFSIKGLSGDIDSLQKLPKNNMQEIMLTHDHIQPHAKGGSDGIENAQTLCHICNMLKADNENLSLFDLRIMNHLYWGQIRLQNKKSWIAQKLVLFYKFLLNKIKSK